MGLLCRIEKCAKNCQKKLIKPPAWVFFAELKNVLKMAKKPPKTSWVFFAEFKMC